MQTWLITGCSSGLGRGFAKAVLKSGDQVIVTARRVETLKDLVDAYPEQALALSLDVTKEEDIKNAVEKGLERFGTIDVLINNAGYGYRAAVEEGVPKEVDQLFQTNLFGPIALIKAVLPIMRRTIAAPLRTFRPSPLWAQPWDPATMPPQKAPWNPSRKPFTGKRRTWESMS